MKQFSNYVDGAWVAPVEGQYLDVHQPATGVVYGRLPASGAADVALAVAAAHRAFPAWASVSPEDRFAVLYRISEGILRNLDKLAEAESFDSGKTVAAARTVDIPRAAQNFSFFASALLHFASESHHLPGSAMSYTLRQPLGVVGCISPWNLPLYLFSWKIAPALAAGNCVVGKPSEVTPLTASLLADICGEAGLPAGVLNLIHGTGPDAGSALVRHPDVRAISFTGSTRAGAEIARIAAPMFKKLSLELGGKNPNIIFADCDYDKMLEATIRSSFNNQGQICLCGSRIYIEERLFVRFRNDFVQRVKSLIVGDPSSPQSHLGAVVSEAHFEKVCAHIRLAVEEGGNILCGGSPVFLPEPHRGGWYIQPTVIEGLPLNCRTNQEEIFGPVVTIQPFAAEAEALELANGTVYGLSATLWTRDIGRAQRFTSGLKAGIVWVNTWMLRDLRTPFGGVGQSGVGREGGWEAMRFFTEAKNITYGL
jgi:aminomuconate-semialdehyde/2-hydroxymuconate-6-semialdehyde dehydrogenase